MMWVSKEIVLDWFSGACVNNIMVNFHEHSINNEEKKCNRSGLETAIAQTTDESYQGFRCVIIVTDKTN